MSGDKTRQLVVARATEIDGKFPHGQFLFDRPGLFMNFACEADDVNVAKVEAWAGRLDEFLRGDAPYLEFESPHLPGRCYLSRYGAQHIVGVFPAWSDKVRPTPTLESTELVNVEGRTIPIVRPRNGRN